jgi:hypothetical protein
LMSFRIWLAAAMSHGTNRSARLSGLSNPGQSGV